MAPMILEVSIAVYMGAKNCPDPVIQSVGKIIIRRETPRFQLLPKRPWKRYTHSLAVLSGTTHKTRFIVWPEAYFKTCLALPKTKLRVVVDLISSCLKHCGNQHSLTWPSSAFRIPVRPFLLSWPLSRSECLDLDSLETQPIGEYMQRLVDA